jgi:hypothetical protein
MIIGFVLLAALATPPAPISVTTAFESDGAEVVTTVWHRTDVYRYEAEVLGTDYLTYRKALKKLGTDDRWRTWRDHEGYDWTRSSTTTCRSKGAYGRCVSH